MQNNSYIQFDPLGALPRAYNQPVQRPIQSQQQYVQPQLTPETLAAIESLKAGEPAAAEQLKKDWWGSDWNPTGNSTIDYWATVAKNVPQDIGQIATGLASMGYNAVMHPIKTAQDVGQATKSYLSDLYQRASSPNTGNAELDKMLTSGPAALPMNLMAEAGKDIYNNLWLGNVPLLHTKTIGEVAQDLFKGDSDAAYKKLREAGIDSAEKFKQDPLITSMIVAPNATAKAATAAGKGVLNLAEKAGIPIGEVSQNVAKAIQGVESKFAKDKNSLLSEADNFRNVPNDDMVTLLRNYAEGTELPERLIPLKEKFAKFQENYRKTFDDDALVNPNELSALEYVQRKTGMNMQDIRRELAPQLEMIQEGVENPALSLSNRLSDFKKEVNSYKKHNKIEDFLNDNKKLSELSENEFNTLGKYFSANELGELRVADTTVKEAKKIIGDEIRRAWDESKVGQAALSDVRFQENLGRLASLAEESGNQLYKHLYDGIKLANEGKIGSFTMAGAKIPAGEKVSNEGRRFQGKSSSREYGTASYEELANAYKNMDEFIDSVTLQRTKDAISNNILETGTIDGATKLVGNNINPKDIRYINSDLLAEGRLSEAIKRASKDVSDGAIPIDKYTLSALDSTLQPTNSPFAKGWTNDAYGLMKETMLAGGQYLGGNFLSGVLGTTMNSGTGLIQDAIAAIGTRGKLAQQIGAFRRIRPSERRYATALAQIISKVGRKLGTGIAPRIDAMMQNMFSEINTHGKLRKLGVPITQRESELAKMQGQQLGEFVNNVRLDSMLNNKFRLIPRGSARGFLGLANPFIDWLDTSAQVSAKMYKEHPILAGAAAGKLFGEIAYDKELQNRLNLGVYTNKPLVTYVPDDKTGGKKEVSISFLPQYTTLELLQNPAKLLSGNNGAVVIGSLYNAIKGQDAYGRPMRRTTAREGLQTIQGNSRYWINPETNRVEEITGKTMIDEVLSTAIRNTFAPVNMYNKTVLPLGTEIYNKVMGTDYKYYQPFGQSIMGSWNVGQSERGPVSRNILSTGNPAKERTISDILKGLGTIYERNYYPEGQLSPNKIKQIRRQGLRQNIKQFGE